MEACGLPGHIIGYFSETERGRRSAAPFGLLISLALHLAFALFVMAAWKTDVIVRPTEVTLVDVVRPASTAPQSVAEPAPAPKPEARQVVRGKSRAMPKPEPEARPDNAVKPEPVRTPLKPAFEQVPPKATETLQDDGASDIATVHAPLAVPHIAVPARQIAPVPGNEKSSAEAAPASPAGLDIGPIMRSYTDKLREIIESRIDYPVVARRARLEGTCTVACRLMPSGEVSGIKIERSTGHRLLDKAALRAVSDAGSFPPPPPSICTGEIDVKVPVTFSLTGR